METLTKEYSEVPPDVVNKILSIDNFNQPKKELSNLEEKQIPSGIDTNIIPEVSEPVVYNIEPEEEITNNISIEEESPDTELSGKDDEADKEINEEPKEDEGNEGNEGNEDEANEGEGNGEENNGEENNGDNGDNEEIIEEPNKEDPMLVGGARDIEYKIDYIIEDDEKLINPERVFKRVNEYINNYNNEIMNKYNQSFKNIYQKYSNRKYIITIMETAGDASKIVVMRNDDKKDIITEITKPIYFYYNENNGLDKMKKNISNMRSELQYEYEILKSKINLLPEEKKTFEKTRKKFIEYLENYYTYTLYHKKINNIDTSEKVELIIQEISGFYKENIESQNPVLFGNIFSVDKVVIDNMNKTNSEKLTMFNDIMLKLGGKKKIDLTKDKKLMEEIKEYLNKNEMKKNNENINKLVKKQNEYINYIIQTLPILE